MSERDQPPVKRGANAATERVRKIALALPATSERVSHGEAAWFIGEKKGFAAMRDHHHDDRLAVVVAAAEGVQGSFVTGDPDRYFIPPYVGGRGWLGIYLDGTGPRRAQWDVIGDLVRDAWILVAPAKIRSQLDPH